MKECLGGNEIDLLSGFWRANNLTDKIEECKNMRSNCPGGKAEFTCKKGNIGALCESCDFYAEKA